MLYRHTLRHTHATLYIDTPMYAALYVHADTPSVYIAVDTCTQYGTPHLFLFRLTPEFGGNKRHHKTIQH